MRTGIVGCGRISAFHLPPVLSRVGPGAVSVTDANPATARHVAAQHGLGSVHSDLDAMLAESRPDVVHILTPPATHAALAIRALKAGCHVLVEKPMAMSAREARAMVDTAVRNNVKLCVDHNFLFHPMVQKALQLIEQGRAGKVLNAEVRYAFDARRAQSASADSREPGDGWLAQLKGGLLFDILPHPASVLLQVIGEPVGVSSVMRSNGILADGDPDEVTVLVDGTESAGTLSLSLGTRPDCFTVTIYATEMTLHVNCSNMTMLVRRHRRIPKAAYRVLDNLAQAASLATNTVTASAAMTLGKARPPGDITPVIDRFYDSIEKGLMPPVPGRQAAHVMRLADDIWTTAPDAAVANFR